ncbi:MAG: invasin domain 3-containing protein, partial [Anaerolineae bacterium]
ITGSGATTAQGVLTRTLTSTKSGQPQIYVNGILAIGDNITFVAGPLHHIGVTPYGSSSIPVPTTAEVGLPFTATGYDVYDNPLSGLTFVWTKVNQGGDGIISSNGLFTGTLAGKVQVKATLGLKSGASFVNVGPGTAVMATIDADTTTLPANGSSTANLTFYVKDIYGNLVGAGIPLTVVSSIGTVEGSGATASNGIVYRTIHSTEAGQAVISVTNLTTVTGENVITFTPGTPSRANIVASSTALPANGVATSTIVITLLDNFGNPVGVGYTPVIQASAGTISGSGSTDSNGVVTRTLIAPLTPGSASFVVKYLGVPLSVSGDTVAFVVGPLDHVLVNPSGLVPVSAGQPVTFTAQAYDEFNAPIASGVTYGWNLEFTGPGSGTQNTFDGPQVIFTGTTAGTGVKLTAWAEKGSPYAETSIDITVLPGPPAAGSLAVAPATIPADGVTPITFTLTNLMDAYGNTAAENSVVTATVQSAPVARTNTGIVSAGEANIFVAATTQAGTYPISMTSAFGPLSLTGPTGVTFIPGPPAQAALVSATPATLVADGVSITTLVLQLRDAFGNKVAAGLTPLVSATLGAILPGGAATDSNGLITRTLQAGLEVGQPVVSINGFAASGPAISFIPGPPLMAYVTVTTSTLAAGGASTPVTFDVRDAWNHPVADGTLITPTLTPAYGAFSGVRQTTGGIVNQTLTPGSSVGLATIGSAGLTVSGDTLINFVAGPAAIALIDAASTSLLVGNTTALTITVTDAYSNVIPPTLITTTALLGILDGSGSTVAKTTANGSTIITASLSSTGAGTETLTLLGPSGPLSLQPSSDIIRFLPSTPVVVTLNPGGPLTATAGVTLTVTASSRDQYGNAVDPWTPVNYTWWQSATINNPGYGILWAADAHARAVNFKPTKVGPNRLWATGGVTTSNILDINVVAGAPAVATAAISPGSVPADGSSLYTVTLTGLTDAFGNAIPDGTPLTATVKSIPPVVGAGILTAGAVTITLPASVDAGTHSVEVSGTGGLLALSGQTTMIFTPGAPVRAFVDATPETLPADGVSTATIVVSVYDEHFNLVADGLPITVTASAGTLTGSGATANGQVTRSLRAPIALGTAGFTVATPDGPLFASGDTVDFVPGSPAQALVIATPAKVLADGVSTSQITVTIKDGYGFTTPGNGATQLSVMRGSLTPTSTVASAGSVTTTFKASTSTGLAGLSIIYNGTSLPTVGDTLELVPGLPVSATIAANPKSLAAGTSQQSNLTVSLSDAWGRAVADGTVVTVTTSLGSILPNTSTTMGGVVTRILTPGLTIGTATFTVTTSSGSLAPAGDRVSITAGSLDHLTILPTSTVQVMAGSAITFSAKGYDVNGNETGTGLFNWKLWPSGGNGTLSSNGVFTGTLAGLVGVQVSQGSLYSPIKDVTILPGTPITALVSASPITIPVGGATSVLTITARDAFGNLVANGTTLNITSNLGTLSGSTTTQNGVLTRTLTSGIYPGQVVILVNGWEAGGSKVTFMPQSRVTANPASLYADGVSETVLTIEVFDASGAPAPDGTMPSVTTSLGTLSGSGGTVNGRLTRTLRASLTPGVADIFVGGFQAQGSVPFVVGLANMARISANPTWLMADGTSQSNLTITVQDAYGHVITNANPLTVTASRGTLSGSAPMANGVTTRVLTASTQSGAAIIAVAGLTTAGDTKIHFVSDQLYDVGFESGNLDSWTVGQVINPPGSTPAYSATVLSSDVVGGIAVIPPSGQKMARLGATTADNTVGHRLSEAWVSQPVYITPSGLSQLTFWYRLLSFDVSVGSPNNGYKEWDPFEVYVNGREVLQDGYAWSQDWENWHRNSPTTPKDMGWKQGVLDLSSYAGQVVTLEFRVPNRQGPVDNTWVYLDGFNLTYRQTPIYKTFIPLVLK